jgi:hypothetical protein
MAKSVFFAVLLVASAGAALCAQSPRAIIRNIQGTVEIKAPGASAWKAATEGQELEQTALVSTGFGSFARIVIGASSLFVQPLTRLSIAELQASPEAQRIGIRLRAGRIRVDARPPAAGNLDFSVRSPMATASVRGTVFAFDTVNLRVDEGAVYFSGADNSAVRVAAGQTGCPDPVSGRTAAPVETAAALAAPAPAGVEAAAAPPKVIPGPVPQSPVNIRIRWND